jgi:hypothetical protein
MLRQLQDAIAIIESMIDRLPLVSGLSAVYRP